MHSTLAQLETARLSLDGEWVDDNDERFFYQFNTAGSLSYAAFAQTRDNGINTPWTAQNRAMASYLYDDGGRMISLLHTWQTKTSLPAETLAYSATNIDKAGVKYAFRHLAGPRATLEWSDSVVPHAARGHVAPRVNYARSTCQEFSELRAPRAIRRPLAVWRRLESGVNSYC
ncbi:MAG: hypothetical protein ABL949_04235 [Fimbriimonadaceae bacterium]